jgi:hypothetical protein
MSQAAACLACDDPILVIAAFLGWCEAGSQQRNVLCPNMYAYFVVSKGLPVGDY